MASLSFQRAAVPFGYVNSGIPDLVVPVVQVLTMVYIKFSETKMDKKNLGRLILIIYKRFCLESSCFNLFEIQSLKSGTN